MCGIFGYVGTRTAEPLLLDGLRTLEYRGYDSAGIFVPGYGVVKSVGPIDALTEKITDTVPGTSGIAHTRWATHGAPTEQNAHPHSCIGEQVWIVHNGIIENYQELKEGLQAQGITFNSDTDSEVLAKLIGVHTAEGDLATAVQRALQLVRGTYGLAAVRADAPEQVVVARMGSPIVLGIAPDGHYLSSDPSALLAHTKDVVYLHDGEVATVHADSYQVMTLEGRTTSKQPEKIEWDIESVQKQGYEHFMLKEIMEMPQVVTDTTRGRLLTEYGTVKLGGLEAYKQTLGELDRLTIVGCGSAYFAGLVGKHLLEEYAGLPVDLELGSEYRYKTHHVNGKEAILAVSQSGETADTLAAVRLGKENGLLTLGMVNVVGSTIARETDAGMYNHAGPEIAVASTKAFISQLIAFVLLTIMIGRERGTLDRTSGAELTRALEQLPQHIQQVLDTADTIQAAATKLGEFTNVMFIGRTSHVPIAYEGALKLKEVSYTHAEAYAAGELKHGSIALLDEQFPVIALAPQDAVYEKMVSNIEEAKARSAPVVAVTTDGSDVARLADMTIPVPSVHPVVQPIVSTVPLHLLAYYVGVAKEYNVDRPRNLAKSVTVE